MNSYTEQHTVTLKQGRALRLDEEPSVISRLNADQVEASITLPCPSHGYAGGSIHTSPSEQYILFAYYSGQSEEAFSIFRNDENLTPIYESGYRSGECASYAFSPNEDRLVQVLPYYCAEWYYPWIENDTEEDDAGNCFFPFGELNLIDLPDPMFESHDVIIRPPTNWRPKERDYDPETNPRFFDSKTLRVDWPWSQQDLTLPLKGDIVIRPGNKSSE